jgi:Tfp pilus assembly protein PilO
LQRFYREILPLDLPGARRATYVLLARLARDAELQYQRRMEDTEVPRAGEQSGLTTLARFAITMVLKGEYESVRQFIRDIEASDAFIVIDNVALAEGTEPGSSLTLTVELSTYFLPNGHVQ